MTSPADKPPSLAATQAEFAAGLVAGAEGVPRGVIGRNSAPPLKRFNIHRNTLSASLIEVLRARYPVVERLVGAEFFNAAAHRFTANNPPRSPALLEFGGGFADYLAAFAPAQGLPYLPDVARLEWLRHAAYHAPDAEPIGAAALAEVPPEQLGQITLRLHPSAGLLASDYPVLSIWETNTADAAVRRIDPAMAGEAALVIRPALEVRVMRLGPGGDSFLGEIGQGACLASAAAHATGLVPKFALAGALGALIAAGAFSGFSLNLAGVD